MRGDVILKNGYRALSCRLRRLSDRLDRDLRDVYQAYGVQFDPAWYPVVAALATHGPLSLSEVAECTGLNPTSVAALRSKLAAEGIVEVAQDPRDLRRQRLNLTPKARVLTSDLDGLWSAIGKASQALCAETVPDLLNELELVEMALSRRRMPARVKALLDRSSA
jgi:DNA-binding MarR family transcriptional regulator